MMASYNRIILPLDGSEASEQALPFVMSLATRLSIPVRLLLAVDQENPVLVPSHQSGRHWNDSESARAATASSYLDQTAARLKERGIEVDTTIPRREPAGAIVEEAGKDEDALIAMASHGRTGLARWWMGSVADKVLHMADNPLLIIRVQEQIPASSSPMPERLIVPLDGSEVGELSLPHAAYMATAMELPVKLIQVTPSEAEYYSYMATGPGFVPTPPPSSPSIPEMIDMTDRDSQVYLAAVRDRLINQSVRSVETQVMQGAPADCIADLAVSDAGSLVVMTTHGRSGVGRMLLGSVAERVVRHSGCPVLLVRAKQN